MKKTIGILLLLIIVCVITGSVNPDFLSPRNIENTLRWTGLFGIIGIGVSFVIISGGIDLSIGSVIGLIATLLPLLLVERGVGMFPALTVCVIVTIGIGLSHGLLITKLRLQPFVVTLCGLLLYRGIARLISDDQNLGFGSEYESLRGVAKGTIPITESFELPFPFILMLVIAAVAAVLLNLTVYGRYLLALGNNEDAARYSGINTDRIVIVAYVISAAMAGLAGVLFALDVNSVQPSSFGEFYELYAIAAAVLGGCSLRGGEGSILGVVIGTAVIRVLRNSINILRIPTTFEFAVIGAVLLLGVIADELVKRFVAWRRTRARAP